MRVGLVVIMVCRGQTFGRSLGGLLATCLRGISGDQVRQHPRLAPQLPSGALFSCFLGGEVLPFKANQPKKDAPYFPASETLDRLLLFTWTLACTAHGLTRVVCVCVWCVSDVTRMQEAGFRPVVPLLPMEHTIHKWLVA